MELIANVNSEDLKIPECYHSSKIVNLTIYATISYCRCSVLYRPYDIRNWKIGRVYV